MIGQRPRQAGTARAPPRRRSSRRRGSPLGDDGFPVVGLGASAGGLDAFRRLLAALPAGSGMAFILIQHLDPTLRLAEYLERRVGELDQRPDKDANVQKLDPKPK